MVIIWYHTRVFHYKNTLSWVFIFQQINFLFLFLPISLKKEQSYSSPIMLNSKGDIKKIHFSFFFFSMGIYRTISYAKIGLSESPAQYIGKEPMSWKWGPKTSPRNPAQRRFFHDLEERCCLDVVVKKA